MEFLSMGSMIFIVVIVLILWVIFYIYSLKFFQPSEIVATPSFKKNTGKIDEDANPIYSYYNYQRGGRVFLPFWKNYFVLSTHLITSSVRTQKFLTKDQIYVKVDFVVQYHIDVSSADKTERAFELFEDFVKDKQSYLQSNKNSQKFASNFEHLFKGVVPEVLGKMSVDELMENREKANEAILTFIRDDFEDNGVVILGLKIEYIDIRNKAYLKKLEEITAEKQEIELIKEQNKIQIEKADFYDDKLKIEQSKQDEKFAKASAKIEFDIKVKQKKIEQNLLLIPTHKDEEAYNKSLLLTTKRAKKETLLELKKIELQLQELEAQKKKVIEQASLNQQKIELEAQEIEAKKKKVAYEVSMIGKKKPSKPKPKVIPKTTTQKIKEGLKIDSIKSVKDIKNLFSRKSKESK